jgi:hypothetical protein
MQAIQMQIQLTGLVRFPKTSVFWDADNHAFTVDQAWFAQTRPLSVMSKIGYSISNLVTQPNSV